MTRPVSGQPSHHLHHQSAAGRFDRLKEIALIYAFVPKVSGKAG